MTIESIMAMRAGMPKSVHLDLSPKAINLWNPDIRAEAEKGEATISILDVIGSDYIGEGVTARRIAGALRSIGKDKPVTVYINSPGGDMFEGLAINSLLQEHKGQVTVKVLALAASAASVIAMGADDIQIARGAFFMIHNAWVVAAGNKNELRDVADWLDPFDNAMADIYAERTGQDIKSVIKAMDKETWIGGTEAVELGYADQVIDFTLDDSGSGDKSTSATVRKMDLALAKAGYSRTDRRKLINEFKASMSGAADLGTHDATQIDTSGAVELDLSLSLGSLSANLASHLKR
jgi:ATP-dependent Clp protease protease subunit